MYPSCTHFEGVWETPVYSSREAFPVRTRGTRRAGRRHLAAQLADHEIPAFFGLCDLLAAPGGALSGSGYAEYSHSCDF